MFARATALLVLAAPLFVAALPQASTDQCNTGDAQCCDSTQNANDMSSSVTSLLGLLGVAVGSLTGLVGVNCAPITVIGTGSTSCTAQPVCCTGNSFNGVVALGCTPINVGL